MSHLEPYRSFSLNRINTFAIYDYCRLILLKCLFFFFYLPALALWVRRAPRGQSPVLCLSLGGQGRRGGWGGWGAQPWEKEDQGGPSPSTIPWKEHAPRWWLGSAPRNRDRTAGNSLKLHWGRFRFDISENLSWNCWPGIRRGCPRQWWGHHPQRDLEAIGMQHLGTWVSGGLAVLGWLLNFMILFPNLNVSVILFIDSSIVEQAHIGSYRSLKDDCSGASCVLSI